MSAHHLATQNLPLPSHLSGRGRSRPGLIRPAALSATRSPGNPPGHRQRSAKCGDANGVWLVIIAILGLLLTPVECAVAMGPHSLFLTPDSVASLQTGRAFSTSAQHAHNHATPADGALQNVAADASGGQRTASRPSETHDAAHDAPSARSGDAANGSLITSPPRTAGFASDAIIAFSLPGLEADLAANHIVRPMFPTVQFPPDRYLTGPEPPPP